MKIIIIGLGSIGQRHLQNLLLLGYTDITIVSRKGVLPGEYASLQVFSTIEEALHTASFDAGIVCTPTALHLQSVKSLLQAHVPNIYIEKPVSHSLDDVDIVLSLAALYPNNIVVGYDLHFDQGLQKVKQLLQGNIIGPVVSVNAQVGQYLPDWRPYEDYKQGMSAKKSTGGGVMLDLVHEFDYLMWLFGDVKTVACHYTNSGALNIETEDACEVLLQFKNNAIGTIHLDYLQQKLVRNCLITGHKGSIFWNLAESTVRWINNNKEETIFNYTDFERNDRFIEIMVAFLEVKDDERLVSLEQGIKSLQLVLAAKQSAETNAFVQPSTLIKTVTA